MPAVPTKIRATKQLFIDDDFDFNAKKLTNLATPTTDYHAATKKYVDDSISGSASAVHAPVADLAAIKALTSSTLVDKMLVLIETLGTYRWDAEATTAGDDVLVITPTDITEPAPGRWYRITATLSNHNLMGGLQGGTTNEYNHLTNAEVSKLGGIEASADVTDAGNVGSSIHGATAKTTMADADKIAIIDTEATNVLKTLTWAYVKSILTTAFNSVYAVLTGTTATSWTIRSGSSTGKITITPQQNAGEDHTMTIQNAVMADDITITIPATTGTLALTSQLPATYVVRETPTGTKNGSNPTFTLAHAPVAGTEMVFVNGSLMEAGADTDYTISTNTITLIVPPIATDKIFVTYYY